MRLHGVHYDVGTDTLEGKSTRATLPREQAERELTAIARELNANAVRLTGRDVGRLEMAGEIAARHGLEIWLSPVLPNGDATATMAQLAETARVAERLRQQGQAVTLVAGCELSVFMAGILPGADAAARLALLADPTRLVTTVAAAGGDPFARFAAVLVEAVATVRAHFEGTLTYASAMWEEVDWSLFDCVGIDAYRDAGNRQTYAADLRAYARHGKPIVVTEFGCATYQGAADQGSLAWNVVERAARPPRLRSAIVRDEVAQARELAAALDTLESAGVDGAFVYTYIMPSYPSSNDAALDLDTASYSLARTWPDGRTEPKEAFQTIAAHYARSR